MVLVCGAGLILSSCVGGGGEGEGGSPARPLRPVAQDGPVADYPVKIGPSYDVGGRTYTPDDTLNYDEVGYATWYGDEMAGATTANGESFVPSGISAAHKTLPLPSYVEVTSLDSGRTILVRINDRGPFTNDRIIDLSRGAAEQLGISDGAAAVRVRRVNPPEQERAVLRAHGRAAERLETPAPLLAVLRQRLGGRPPVPTAAAPRPKPPIAAKPGTSYPAPPSRGQGDFVVEQPGRPSRPAVSQLARPAPGGTYIVQVAAFSSRDRAASLARSIGASAVESGGIWRVRFGPYPSQEAAQAGVRAAAAKGYPDARVYPLH
ncbi:MAG: septal ring lytic transglycosylase RlpA family protein [Sphingobium sp.]